MATTQKGFKGISFPFRIGVKGGVVMSTTSQMDVAHIVESMEQIVRTRPFERCMEYAIKCDVDYQIFEPNDSGTHTLIAYQVERALSDLEDRIEVKSVDIEAKDNFVYANVTFRVLKYDTVYTQQIKVGDLSNVQNSNS